MAANYTDLMIQQTQERSWIKDLFVVLGASVIIALFAPISVYLPFTPVPIATQGHVILFLAALLGSKRGSLAVLTFLFQGMIGFPVFSGGLGGIARLAGPTGGFLLGYVAAAFITGYLIERMRNRTASNVFGAMGIGNAVLYVCGLPWLASFLGWKSAIVLGMLPFLLGDLLKLIAATRTLKGLRFFS